MSVVDKPIGFVLFQLPLNETLNACPLVGDGGMKSKLPNTEPRSLRLFCGKWPGSVGMWAAFTSDLADAVAALVSRYHDAGAPGGRSHRLVVVAHPVPAGTRPDTEEAS